jgi:NhaP-type Na+/H+ or K+/H+ antiporter
MNHLKLGVLGESIKLISSASPTGILAIFLPVLIFESSFRTEWHIFKKLAGQSLILGILSSLVSAAFIMLLVKLSLDPENVELPSLRSFTAGMRPLSWAASLHAPTFFHSLIV